MPAFRTELSRRSAAPPIEGVAENLSQGGAFIKTTDWRSFQTNERTLITIFIGPEFSGQDATIGLQGEAVISRVDPENEGIAVRFTKSFKQFEPIDRVDVAGKVRYKRLSSYLSTFSDPPLLEFVRENPNGFFVEKTEEILDQDIVYQFGTSSLEDQDMGEESIESHVLEARVIEIRKKKADTPADQITIGRSADNDIVLYNKVVSKYHACLYIPSIEEGCFLLDIGSKNGTFLNGNKLTPYKEYPLIEGDEISFGRMTKIVYFSPKAFHGFLSKLKSAAS